MTNPPAEVLRTKIEQTRLDAATHTWTVVDDITTQRDGLAGLERVRCSECGATGRRAWFINADDAMFTHGPTQRSYDPTMTGAGPCTYDRRRRHSTLLVWVLFTIVCLTGAVRAVHRGDTVPVAVLWVCWMGTGWLTAVQTLALQRARKTSWLRERTGERDEK